MSGNSLEIFVDGASPVSMLELSRDPGIHGVTTNPTLMRVAGVTDYAAFGKMLASQWDPKPVCLEVVADEFEEMERQARVLASFGSNVVVKIPVTTTQGESCAGLIERLGRDGVSVNVTAVMSPVQIDRLHAIAPAASPAMVSIFAGRIADAGTDPCDVVKYAVARFAHSHPRTKILWASCRQIYNVVEAERVGCHIVTIPHNMLAKLQLLGKDLNEFSRETVQQFYSDAQSLGLSL